MSNYSGCVECQAALPFCQPCCSAVHNNTLPSHNITAMTNDVLVINSVLSCCCDLSACETTIIDSLVAYLHVICLFELVLDFTWTKCAGSDRKRENIAVYICLLSNVK